MSSREPQSPEAGGWGPFCRRWWGGSSQSLEGRGWDGKLHHDSPQASIPAGGGVGVVEEIGGEPLRASSSRARGWSRRISGFKVPEPPPRSLFPMSAIHKSNLIVRSKEETPGRGRKSACYAWPVSDLWASLSLRACCMGVVSDVGVCLSLQCRVLHHKSLAVTIG